MPEFKRPIEKPLPQDTVPLFTDTVNTLVSNSVRQFESVGRSLSALGSAVQRDLISRSKKEFEANERERVQQGLLSGSQTEMFKLLMSIQQYDYLNRLRTDYMGRNLFSGEDSDQILNNILTLVSHAKPDTRGRLVVSGFISKLNKYNKDVTDARMVQTFISNSEEVPTEAINRINSNPAVVKALSDNPAVAEDYFSRVLNHNDSNPENKIVLPPEVILSANNFIGDITEATAFQVATIYSKEVTNVKDLESLLSSQDNSQISATLESQGLGAETSILASSDVNNKVRERLYKSVVAKNGFDDTFNLRSVLPTWKSTILRNYAPQQIEASKTYNKSKNRLERFAGIVESQAEATILGSDAKLSRIAENKRNYINLVNTVITDVLEVEVSDYDNTKPFNPSKTRGVLSLLNTVNLAVFNSPVPSAVKTSEMIISKLQELITGFKLEIPIAEEEAEETESVEEPEETESVEEPEGS